MKKIQNSIVFFRGQSRFLNLVFSLLILSFSSGNTFAQIPTWVSGTPATGTPGPTSLPVDYGINTPGTVYIVVFNYNYGGTLTSTGVRNSAIAGPSGALVATAVIPVTMINTVLQHTITGLSTSTLHSIYIVAANSSGTLQASPVKLVIATQPCPKIQLFNFFGNTGECVNLGAQGVFQVTPLGSLPTGILAGSQWSIDWGDGSPIWTYTSTADDDLPPPQYHDFSSTTNCAYVGTWTVKNPCNEFYAAQGVFVVHGRDIPDDGDGRLEMQETTTGDVGRVYVCEGSEHNLFLRDISIWNCQNPSVPPPLNPADYDNDSPRRIQFVYGETPSGSVMNTITGNVLIGGSNVANGSHGYVGPVLGPLYPPNPNTLTDQITIPATCKAGELFYVYLKDWNKCNPFIDASLDYVYEQFVIEVIPAPPAPAVDSPQTYCQGSVNPTLTATISLAGNTLNWYADENLTNHLHTGNTFTHGRTLPGNYSFWVTETSQANGCEGPASRIDITIRESLTRPGIISGPSEVCINATNQVFSVPGNPPTMPFGGPTEFFWTVPSGWTIVSGQGSRQIVVNIGGPAGSRSLSVINRYINDPRCPSPSRSVNVTVSPLAVGGNVANRPAICVGSSVTMTVTGHTGTVVRWERRLLPSGSWSSIASTTTSLTNTPPTTGTWEYRAVIGSGSCPPVYSSAGRVQVDPTSVPGTTSGGNTPICVNTPTGNITLTGYTGTIVRWQYRTTPTGTWTNISNTTNILNYTPTSAGTYRFRAEVKSGSCPSLYSNETVIVVNPASVGGAVNGGTTPICLNSSTGTLRLTGHTGSVIRWERRLGAGAWTTISNTTTSLTDTPPSAGSWEYRAVVQSGVCGPAYSSTRTIVVVPHSVGGSVTGGNTPLCPATNTGTMTLSGHTGVVVRWERRLDGGSWSTITNTATTYSEIPSSSGTWEYRAAVRNSPCDIAYSSPATIVVRPTYSAQLYEDISICNNTAADLHIDLSGGTPPYTISYTRNGTAQPQITGYISGTNISTGILTTGTYIYRITSVVDANGCNAQSLGTPVTVIVGPALNNAVITGSGDNCEGTSSWFSLLVDGGVPPFNVTYTLDGGAPTVVSAYDNNQQIDLGVLALGGHTVHIVSIEDECNNFVPTLPGDYSFNINPIPDAGSTANNASTLCSGGTTAIVLGSDVASTNFSWTVTSSPAVTWIDAPSGGSRTNGNNSVIAQTLRHSGTVPVTVTYTITPTGPLPTSCPGLPVTRTVIVNPAAQVNDPADQVVCNGASTALVNFATNRTGGITTYSWTNSNGTIGLATSGSGNIASFTATNSGTAPVTATITVTPSFEGCAGTPETFTITVNPSGQVNRPADQVVCNGSPVAAVSFTTNRGGGTTTYAWINDTPSIGLVASGSGNISSFNASNSGTSPVTATITVTPSFNGCAGTPEQFTITVNPAGQVNKPADQVVCNGAMTLPVSFTTDRTGGATSYSWVNDEPSIGLASSGTGDIDAFTVTNNGTAPVTATITVTPTFSNGTVDCSGAPQSFTITVNPTAQVNQPADQVHCAGTTVPLFNFGTNRSGGTTTYSWTNSNTSIGLASTGSGGLPAFTATNSGTAPATATITVTPLFTDGGESCPGADVTFTITVNPAGQVNNPGNQVHCNGDDVAALSFTTDRSGGTTTYSWTNSNTSIGLASTGSGGLPLFTATNSGTAPVTATIRVTPTFEGCPGPQQTFTITVNPTPALSSTLTPPAICSNNSFVYTPASLTTGTSFSWERLPAAGLTTSAPDNGTGAVSHVLRNFTSATIPVTYRYTLTANGCSNVQDVVVNVRPEPVISDQSTGVCSGESLVWRILLDNFVNPADNVTFTWPAPLLSGGLVGGTARTVPSSADMTDNFVNTTGLPETATYTVTPVYQGCVGEPKEIVVTIASQPVLGDLDLSVCSNTTTGLVLAVAPTSSPADSYDIGSISVSSGLVAATGNAVATNGVTDVNYLANDLFVNETGVDRTVTYRVRPVLGATCIGDWEDVVVTVRPQPVIAPGQTETVCSNVPASLEIRLVPDNTPAGSTFSWAAPVMSDGSSQGTAASGVNADPAGTPHITDTFENYGATPITATYTVTPYSSHGCAGTPVEVVITINPEPAAPVITGDDMLCTDQVNVIYTVPLTPGSSYSWDVPATVGHKIFDVGSNAIIINAASVAGSGTITVVETNSYGCAGLAGSFDVTVMAPSLPSFIDGDDEVCALSTHIYSVPDNPGSVYTWSLPTGAALIGDPSAASITVTFGTISGNILVREVNAAGCITTHGPLPVTVRPLPTAVVSNSGIVCVEDTHPVTVTLTGTAPWTVVYAINGADQPPVTTSSSPYIINATVPGNYTVTSVTDDNGCTNAGTGNATVSHYPVPSATISGTTAVCAGSSAVITVSLTGTPPYSFIYSDGTTQTAVNNHPAAVYNFTVTPAADVTYTLVSMEDSHGCDGLLSGSAAVTIYDQPVLAFDVTHLLCNGDNSGAIGLTVTGSATNSYAWIGPDAFTAGTKDLSGLKAGIYSVTVTSGDGCVATGQVTVSEPSVLSLASTGNISLLCHGDDSGSGSFTASGGTAPYSFTTVTNDTGADITAGSGSSVTFTNAGSGTITLLVTDANDCTAQATVIVTTPPALTITGTTKDISCYGGGDGTINTTVTGGTTPYVYAWTHSGGGSGLVAGAQNQGGLTAGSYELTVTDANGCQAVAVWTLTQPDDIIVTVTTDDNLIGTCSSAQLNAAVTGGVEPAGGYLYSWSPAAGLSAANISNPVATPTSTTTYTVTVTDDHGCVKTGSVTIAVAPVLTAVAYADDNMIGDCPNQETQLHVNVNGGEAPYSFLWDNSGSLSDPTDGHPFASPSVNTTYTVTVTDANGCIATASVTVNVAPELHVTVTVDDDLIGTCPTSVAQLSATATGGEGPYSYLWDNASTLNDASLASPTAKPAATTTYTVTVTDANGCIATATITVNVAPDLAVTAIADDLSIGTCPGSVSHLDALASGGEPDYTYKWTPVTGLDDSNIRTPVAKPAATTTYRVTVTDANGCTAWDEITITVVPALTLTLTVDDSSIGTCPGSEAQITSTVGGGEPAYSYSWSPTEGLSDATIANPRAKPSVTTTYTLTVTDQNNCTISRDITIVVMPPLVVTATAVDPLIGACPGSDTRLNAFASGGEPGYTYSWLPVDGLDNPSLQSPTAKPLVTTTYTVTVTDNNGCTATDNVTVTVAPELTVTVTVDDDLIGTCPTSVARLQATADGGEPAYTYLWSPVAGLSDPNSPAPTAKPLSTTTYTVLVTDANGCTATASIEVAVAPELTVTVTADDYNIGECPGSDTELRAVAAGGEPGYTYLWSPSAGLDDPASAITRAEPLVTTTYTVLVTDANGCTATASLTITVAPELKAVATASTPDIGTCISSTTTLDVTATGGEPGYTYLWSPAGSLNDATAKNPVAKPLVTTTYTVVVTDNNGCEAQAQVTITVADELTVSVSADDLLIGTCPTSRSTLVASVTGGKAPYSYSWTPAASLNNPNVSSPIAKPLITTTYEVTVKDAYGCEATAQITIDVADELTVSATADDYLIGTCPGSVSQITAIAAGGEAFPDGSYLWSWAPAAGLSATNIPNPEAKPTSTTTYTVTVTDANGCTALNTITIEVAPPLAAVATASDYLIGDCPGSSTTLDVTVTGGELPYVYSWAPAASLSDASAKSPVATPLVTTTYTVTVTDANGCTVTADVTIDIAPPLVATASVDIDPIGSCPTSVARLSTTVSGGEGAYTYLWDNETWLDDETKANPVAKPPASTLFTVTVTDANNCSTTAQVWVNVAPDLLVTVTTDDDLIGTCPGSVANLNAIGSGGVPLISGDYQYNWSPAAGLNYTNVQSPVAKPAVTTTYTVVITDANGCTATGQIEIRVAAPLLLTATPVVYAGGYNITCNGASDGAIDLAVTGGEAPYLYAWSGPGGFTSADEDISGLIAGTYSVTVTDANNCSETTTVVLLEPAPLTLGKTPDVLLSCYGDATATGSFSVSGGTAPYMLSDMVNSAGATVTTTATSLSFTLGGAGEVTALVEDANGCTDQATIYITQPDELLPGTIDGDQEVCYHGDPSTLNEVTPPSGGPATILFQWQYSLDGNAPWSDVPGASQASYDPPAGIAQTTHYRRRATSGSCDPVYSNIVVVTVNPLPVASIDGADFVCPGDAAIVTVTVTTGVAPFTVTLSDGTTVTGYNSGDPITVAPLVTTTYTIVTVIDSKGCDVSAPHANLTGSATISVKSVPEIAQQPVSIAICEDDPATFTVDAGMTTNPLYQWYVDSGSGMTPMPGETAATLTVTALSYMNGYHYQAEISGDCPVPVLSEIVTLTVSEKPEIVTQPDDQSVCAGEDAHFTVDAGVTTNPVYQWFVDTGSGWTPAVGARYQGATTATLTVVSTLEVMSGYRYMVRVSGDCTPYVESDPVTLTVTRQAEITQHPVSLTLCEDEPATFTVDAGLTTNPTYQWERSDDGGATWTPISGATSDSYTIPAVATPDNNSAYRAVVSSTCGSSVTSLPAFLTVNELPEIADQPSDVTICEYAIADFLVDAGMTTGASYQWQRSTDGGGSWVDLGETATYFGTMTSNLKVNGTVRAMDGDMFRVIVSGVCTPAVTSDEVLLTVNTAPEIITQPDAATICEFSGTTFSVTAQGTALTYQWYVDVRDGNGFTAIADGGIYAGATTATLTLTNVPRTYNSYRYRVEIEGTCVPKAVSNTVQLDVSIATVINTHPADIAVCEFMTTSFTAQAEGANLTYQWQADDGSGWADLNNSGVYLGVQTPTLMVFGPSRTMDGTRYRVIIGGDCSADLTSGEALLTVNTAPELTDHPDEFRGCPGGSATFSAAAAGAGLIYQWQVNSGAGFNDVTDDGTYSGTSTPTLTISNLDLSMNGHLVRVVVSGICQPPVTSTFAPLRVYMEPMIIAEPADAEVCDETGVVFYSQVFNTGAGETTVWQVNEGSGWSDLSDDLLYQGTQTPQLVIVNAVTAMNGWLYRLEITGPCGNYYTREALLTVNTPPTAQIAPTDTLLVCGGVPTQLHGNPAGGSLTYTVHRWYGDIGPLNQFNIENPVFNTTMAGYYRLIYQVTDSKGCVGLDTLVIEVERPQAMFTADLPSGCPPLTVSFTNGSTGYTSLLWDFGDGHTSTDIEPTHTYGNPGSALAYHTVRLEVTSANGCVSFMESNITVYPEIGSDFVLSNDTICSGESVMFSTLPGAFRYYWDYGDGFMETGSNVISHTYYNTTTDPVTYDVTLRTESFFGCVSETTLPLVVYPTPVPGFIATPASQVFPDATVSFSNTTTSGTWSWLWRFDDGNTSAEYEPIHTYAAPGDYNVSLRVSNEKCYDEVVHTVRVLPTPPVALFDSIPSGCQPWSVDITNNSLYATSYYWDFGDGHTSNARHPKYTYVQAGVYQVTLTVTGPGGVASRSQVVHVYPSPRAYFDISPPKVYVNDEEIRLFNLSEGGSTFIWEFGDGDTSHVRDPFHKYTKEGIYDITLHAYSENGCYDTYVKSPGVTVEPFGDLIFASVFKPNTDGPIDIDGLPTSGDAVDQFFYPPIRETVLEYHLQIFNRWGVLIFETYDINKPWNGYYKGQLCQQGVYVWLVEGKYANGRPFKKAGDITLLH